LIVSLRNFSWIREGDLAVSARPQGIQGLLEARETGIQAIVTLTEAPLGKSELEECGLVALHLPVRDFSPPSLEQIQTFTRFWEEQRALGRSVLIHCDSGQGRSGTMAACHLVSQGLDPHEALAEVRRLRPGSVETEEQEQVVQAWADLLRSRSTDPE
jgi:atypical dual specificity phosphatase